MPYTTVAKWLHWLIAGAIVVQFLLAELAEHAAEELLLVQQLALLAHHKSVGITVLLLALARIFWRITHQPPPSPTTMSLWQVRASAISHWSLYGLLFAMPLTGWLMSSASAYSVSWFNLVALPDLVAPSESLKDNLQQWHGGMAKGLVLLAGVHILAAFKHGLVDRDGVLGRMSSLGSVSVFFVVIALGAYVLSPSNVPDIEAEHAQQTSTADHTPVTTSDLPSWQIDYTRSQISFSTEQAGAPFTGYWLDWSADVQFHAQDLDNSQAVVSINVQAVNTQDEDRDSTLLGSDFFAADVFPSAEFRTVDIQASNTGFKALGTLTIKSVPHAVEFNFTIARPDPAIDNLIELTGSSRLDRLALGIGLGDWQDPSWVAQYVDVSVTIVATTCTDTNNNMTRDC